MEKNVPTCIFMRKFLLPLLALFCAAPVAPVFAAESAVVLMYHRFGETRYPSTSVTI